MSSNSKEKKYYLPTILLGFVVAAIFIFLIFTFQVAESERALVLTMGRISGAPRGPGLHLRLPLPFQQVITYDVRKRTFDGNIGKLEEVTTRDQKQVVVGITVIYSIDDLEKFKTAKNLATAEEFLSSCMRTAKASVIGKYELTELVNTEADRIKLEKARREILDEISPKVMDAYGLKVYEVNFSSLIVPKPTAEAIAKRMKQERERLATTEREKGNLDAKNIKTKADAERESILTSARAEAKRIRAEGDAEAAKYYSEFKENPALAAFLKKLEMIKDILNERTTLILSTDDVPFDTLKSDFSTKLTLPAPSSSK